MEPDQQPRGGVSSRRRLWAVLAGVLLVAVTALVVAVVVLRGHSGGPTIAEARPTASARTTPPTSAAPQVAADIGVPDRLLIPAIGVNTPVQSVGTTAAGAQQVPTSIDSTGWWRAGSQPGQVGNAVIVGHTASRADGVFDNLSKVKDGDTITVRSGGRSLTYRVVREQVVPVTKFATVADEIYRRTGPTGLVLMTCGDFDGSRYTSTVIVHARLA